MGREDKVEILAIGNELLNGTTLDTNSHWLSRQLVKMGTTVIRKTTIPDILPVISETFASAIHRDQQWIFSLGGLGPTYDDMTLFGLSKAVHRKIELNPVAVQMIRESRERRILSGMNLPTRLSSSTLKMAELPRGSTPLKNSVGTAPGVFLESRNSKIISLPGVPREMRAIFLEQVVPILRKDLPRFKREERWLSSLGASESSVAPSIQRLMKKYSPWIYIKSHPMGFQRRRSLLKFQLSVSSSQGKQVEARKRLLDATKDLRAILEKSGAKVQERC